jgi:hypothetical protein
MIVTKNIEIKLNQFNYHHYERLGYKTDGKESILVDIKDISKSSPLRIESMCDICGKIKSLTYVKYTKNISHGGFYACSNLCAKVKVESTNIEKYGAKYPLQSPDKVQELKDYFLEKFGEDNPSKTEEVKKKREETMIERFGVKTNLILPETHKKAIKLSASEENIQKRKDTCLIKFGFDNPMKSKEIYQKFKDTNSEKYGCEFPAQNSEIFTKTQKSQFKVKEYKGVKYQGTYELDFLKFCDEKNLLERISKIKSIEYNWNGENKFYHPDFYIKDINLIVEIKSNYYYQLYLEKNICKKKSCNEKGYDFLFIINKDYNEFLNKIKKSS